MQELSRQLSGLTVLIVDHDRKERANIRNTLLVAGGVGEVFEAVDAESGLTSLLANDVDCAFLDLDLPAGDGLWFVQTVRSRGMHIPLIVLTSQGDERKAVESMQAGATDYLPKATLTPERVVISLSQAMRGAQTEDALRLSDQQAHLAVEAARLGTWQLDAKTQILECSSFGRTLLGLSQEHATLDHLVQCFDPDDQTRVAEGIQQALTCDKGGACEVESRVATSDAASSRWLRVVGRVTHDEHGRVNRLVGTLQDVTERRQWNQQWDRVLEAERGAREQAETATRLREDILAVLAHDLRDPLAAITLSAGSLRTMAPSLMAGAVKPLDTILRSAQHMNHLISDLLDVAALENRAVSIRPTSHPVRALISEALDMLTPLAANKSIRLCSDAVPADLEVMADRGRAVQVLSNLVGNAIKFTDEGGRVTIQVYADGEWLFFSVADTGKGIPDDQVPFLFSRYWQANRADRLGVGLGLSIAKGIVEAHGGNIRAESRIGKGATFTFTLPRAALPAANDGA